MLHPGPAEAPGSRAALSAWACETLVPISESFAAPLDDALLAGGARSPSDDLVQLGRMIGDARIVALSEPGHGALEPLAWRNRVFDYLARHHGFTAIGLESGLAESRITHDYVKSGAGCLAAAAAQGLSWTFDRLPQNLALLQTMRRWNAGRRDDSPVNFYGFDLSGSPGDGTALRGVDTALTETLELVERLSVHAPDFRSRLAGVLEHIRFDYGGKSRPGYESLTSNERDRISAVIADLVAWIEAEADDRAASNETLHAWALPCARDAARVDQWLRHITEGWSAADRAAPLAMEDIPFLADMHNTRDRAQADNLEWILEREGPSGRLLVFAARVHMSAAPLTIRQPGGRARVQLAPAGYHLRQRFGSGFVSIGALFNGGEERCGEHQATIERPADATLDGWARGLGAGPFLLDLRDAPADVRTILDQPAVLVAGQDQCLDLPPASAFDILLYFGAVSPACEQAPTASSA